MVYTMKILIKAGFVLQRGINKKHPRSVAFFYLAY